MTETMQEDQVRRAAARFGLKLIKNRYDLTSTDKETYCLRPLWDARQVVGTLSDGRFGLVRATGKGQCRQKVASWLPLNAIELMLQDWRGVRPRSRMRLSQRRHEVRAQRSLRDCDQLVQGATT
jgi:hypothetical protein